MRGVARADDAVELEIDGHAVRITSPGKVLFSERGETKLDLVNYYLAVARADHAHDGRPAGAHGAVPARRRAASRSSRSACPTTRPTGSDHDRQHAQRHDVARARRRRPRAHRVGGEPRLPRLPRVAARAPTIPTHADELRIDLDPQPGVDFDERARPRATSKALLDELGIVGYPKTTGKRGIHVYVRLRAEMGSDPGAAPPRSRSPASSRAAIPTSSPTRGGRRSAASASSSTSTRTRRTRRCSARGACARVPARRCRRRSRGTSSTRSIPTR